MSLGAMDTGTLILLCAVWLLAALVLVPDLVGLLGCKRRWLGRPVHAACARAEVSHASAQRTS